MRNENGDLMGMGLGNLIWRKRAVIVLIIMATREGTLRRDLCILDR